MCGIAGGSLQYLDRVGRIETTLNHRGPDNFDVFKDENLFLAHARLSIQDLSEEANQPFQFNDLAIVFNGEIYNHLELRKKYGLVCSTTSDTETLIQLIDKSGLSILNELDGMFAFCLYNRRLNKYYLVRDRAGKKPVFYYEKGNEFFFASELNTIKAVIPSLGVNENAINKYLYQGFFYENETAYDNVTVLGAGCIYEFDLITNQSKLDNWWSIDEIYDKKKETDYEEAYRTVDVLLDKAVQSRLISSDLEVGCFLSGGIDSGLVTSYATKYTDKLKTFTVAFDGNYDESALAQLVADKFKTDHHVIKIDFDNLLNDFETIVGNYGEPYMDSSAIPSYYVAQKAKEYVTVTLNGDGADELFGGYRRYVPYSKHDFFQKGLIHIGAKLMSLVLPTTHNKKSKYNFVKRLADLASEKSVLETYMSTTTDVFHGYTKSFKTNPLFDLSIDGADGLDKLMKLDFKNILFRDLLPKIDIATMAHSMEGRSPFLSKELLEYAPTLSSQFKIKGTTTKYVLRKLAEEKLPPSLSTQPKRGFEIPLKEWMNVELNGIYEDLINSVNNSWSTYLDKSFVEKLSQNKVKGLGAEKRAKMMYSILCLEVWNKRHN